MEYAVYKFRFTTGVHLGGGRLESATMTFGADRLFSALAFEALRRGEAELDRLVSLARNGKLLISDAFPYAGDEYFCPKPMIRIENKDTEETIAKRKIFKKLEFLPFDKLSAYLAGKAEPEELLPPRFGSYSVKTSVAINPGEDTRPYRIGVFSFKENCGLYVIFGYEEKDDLNFAEDLLDSLAFVGIGGKRSAGLGRFELDFVKKNPVDPGRFTGKYETYMTLCAALPKDEEMSNAMEGATYLLEKKSGFVASPDYADEWRRKRDVFAFKTGSCFKQKFAGELKDVSNGGRHPVYRYLKPMLMGVE